ncbi:hypothetical protein BEP19_15295 [Ammoniphilus oxalaticus]|uniref:GAF domain-containing protein n=1 Tax=Ammoniphilus oxalaticus TaxID=66863 RepID=A0A419SDS4_9BACL|nr:hypothetical protein [Ammoniphilus oxalaticus]RKD21043.1 hypothetical protein BEP19_15295 [Ammoniphilus oxalaticus]
MSKAADITTLELIAAVHQVTVMDQSVYELLVERLHRQVVHFEWVGLYLLHDNQYKLTASAGDQTPDSLARKSILQVPISSSSGELYGKLTVTNSRAIAFDDSDFTSIEALAVEIGLKIESLTEQKN